MKKLVKRHNFHPVAHERTSGVVVQALVCIFVSFGSNLAEGVAKNFGLKL